MLAGTPLRTTWPSGRVCAGGLDLRRKSNYLSYISSTYPILLTSLRHECRTARDNRLLSSWERKSYQTRPLGSNLQTKFRLMFSLCVSEKSPLILARRSQSCPKRKNSHFLTPTTRPLFLFG